MSWTITSISKLKKLWDKGISTSEIGTKLGFSKNAIVGKAHRLGLKSRSNTVIKKIKRKKMPAPKTQAEMRTSADQTIKKSGMNSGKVQPTPISTKSRSSGKNTKTVEMMDLKKEMCRWPLGDPRNPDFSFCGEPTFKNKPYCLTHCTEAYTLSNKKEEKAKDNDSNNSNASEKV